MSNSYGIGVYDYAGKTQFKYQTLMQEYQELQKEAFATKRKLEATKEKKFILAAEVRFLQRRYKLLVKMKTLNLSQQHKPAAQQRNPLGRMKILKEQNLSRKGATTSTLPPLAKVKPKKQKAIKEVASHPASTGQYQHSYPIIPFGKEATQPNLIPKFGVNAKGATARIPNSNFHLNLEEILDGASDAATNISLHGEEGFLPNRFPISNPNATSKGFLPHRIPTFNLNEASILQTADEEIPTDYKAIELREVKKSLLGRNAEVHNDLKVSMFQNDKEASTNTRKRKISWKNPVALRVCDQVLADILSPV